MLGVRTGFLFDIRLGHLHGCLPDCHVDYKYFVKLRGRNGIVLPAVHSRDAKIYLEDPGSWILGPATEALYLAKIAPEVCI
jgi:hypothetical protein